MVSIAEARAEFYALREFLAKYYENDPDFGNLGKTYRITTVAEKKSTLDFGLRRTDFFKHRDLLLFSYANYGTEIRLQKGAAYGAFEEKLVNQLTDLLSDRHIASLSLDDLAKLYVDRSNQIHK
jgi:hypothetical protein